MRWILVLILSATLAGAQDKAAADFDYYVLSLSWTPNWCATEGDQRNAPECAIGRARAFSLHGLWPQTQTGWPEFCRTGARDPSRSQTAAMADIMGSPGLAWYQWRKHGRCSGLDGPTYLATARAAYARITIPPVLARLNRDVRLPAKVVEAAFLDVNPGLTADMITITCRDGRIAEARFCLTPDLDPRLCAPDSRRDCALSAAIMDGVR